LLFDFLRITVEEHVHHDIPAIRRTRDGASKTEHLTRQQPPNQTDGVAGLVVSRNGNIDVSERSIGITKGNDGDVDIRGFTYSLVVNSGVGDNDETGLLERAGDIVGE
jgi:hypothetical protein